MGAEGEAAPAQRLVTRDFAKRVVCEPEEDVLRADLRLISNSSHFSTCSRVLSRVVYVRNSKDAKMTEFASSLPCSGPRGEAHPAYPGQRGTG
jgi:hypothetical protein